MKVDLRKYTNLKQDKWYPLQESIGDKSFFFQLNGKLGYKVKHQDISRIAEFDIKDQNVFGASPYAGRPLRWLLLMGISPINCGPRYWDYMVPIKIHEGEDSDILNWTWMLDIKSGLKDERFLPIPCYSRYWFDRTSGEIHFDGEVFAGHKRVSDGYRNMQMLPDVPGSTIGQGVLKHRAVAWLFDPSPLFVTKNSRVNHINNVPADDFEWNIESVDAQLNNIHGNFVYGTDGSYLQVNDTKLHNLNQLLDYCEGDWKRVADIWNASHKFANPHRDKPSESVRLVLPNDSYKVEPERYNHGPRVRKINFKTEEILEPFEVTSIEDLEGVKLLKSEVCLARGAKGTHRTTFGANKLGGGWCFQLFEKDWEFRDPDFEHIRKHTFLPVYVVETNLTTGEKKYFGSVSKYARYHAKQPGKTNEKFVKEIIRGVRPQGKLYPGFKIEQCSSLPDGTSFTE